LTPTDPGRSRNVGVVPREAGPGIQGFDETTATRTHGETVRLGKRTVDQIVANWAEAATLRGMRPSRPTATVPSRRDRTHSS
jgi:hypothetical protein